MIQLNIQTTESATLKTRDLTLTARFEKVPSRCRLGLSGQERESGNFDEDKLTLMVGSVLEYGMFKIQS